MSQVLTTEINNLITFAMDLAVSWVVFVVCVYPWIYSRYAFTFKLLCIIKTFFLHVHIWRGGEGVIALIDCVYFASLQSVLQRSFHHFDLSSFNFHLTLTRCSLISNQRKLVHCRFTDNNSALYTQKKKRSGQNISNNTYEFCHPLINTWAAGWFCLQNTLSHFLMN